MSRGKIFSVAGSTFGFVRGLDEHEAVFIGRYSGLRDGHMHAARWCVAGTPDRLLHVNMARRYHSEMMKGIARIKARRPQQVAA